MSVRAADSKGTGVVCLLYPQHVISCWYVDDRGEMAANPRSRLGEMLLAERIINGEQLTEALDKCAENNMFLGHALVELGYLTEDQLMAVLVRQCRIPHINLTDYDIDREIVKLIPYEVCRDHHLLPVDRLGSMLTVAMVDPLDDEALRAVTSACDLTVKPVLCTWYDFEQVSRRMFGEEPVRPSNSVSPQRDQVRVADASEVPEIEPAESLSRSEVAVPETDQSSEKNKAWDSDLFRALATKGSRTERRKAIKEALLGRGKPLPKEVAEDESSAPSDDDSTRSVVSEYSFDTFIPSESNEFAHQVARSIAESPGGEANPFFIYGDVGLGKTHLLTSISNSAAILHRDMRIMFVSSSEFGQELAEAQEAGHTKEVRNKYLASDMLLLDDIQFLAGRDQAQEEFFGIFNALIEHHKQIVLAADKHPEELHKIERRLVSRFVGGIVVGLQPPDWTTRMEILYDRMKRSDVKVPAEVLELIATSIPDDVRKLLGAFRKTIAYCTLVKRDVTVEVAQEILSHLHNTPFN